MGLVVSQVRDRDGRRHRAEGDPLERFQRLLRRRARSMRARGRGRRRRSRRGPRSSGRSSPRGSPRSFASERVVSASTPPCASSSRAELRIASTRSRLRFCTGSRRVMRPSPGRRGPRRGTARACARATAATASSGGSSSGWCSGRAWKPGAPSSPTNAIATGASAPKNEKSSDPHERHGGAVAKPAVVEQLPRRGDDPGVVAQRRLACFDPHPRGAAVGARRRRPPTSETSSRSVARSRSRYARRAPRALAVAPGSRCRRCRPSAPRPSASRARAGRSCGRRRHAARRPSPTARAPGRDRGAGTRRASGSPAISISNASHEALTVPGSSPERAPRQLGVDVGRDDRARREIAASACSHSSSAPDGYASSLGWKTAANGAGASSPSVCTARASATSAAMCTSCPQACIVSPRALNGAPVRSRIGSPSSSARTATGRSPAPMRAISPVPATRSASTGSAAAIDRRRLVLGVGELRLLVQPPAQRRRALRLALERREQSSQRRLSRRRHTARSAAARSRLAVAASSARLRLAYASWSGLAEPAAQRLVGGERGERGLGRRGQRPVAEALGLLPARATPGRPSSSGGEGRPSRIPSRPASTIAPSAR